LLALGRPLPAITRAAILATVKPHSACPRAIMTLLYSAVAQASADAAPERISHPWRAARYRRVRVESGLAPRPVRAFFVGAFRVRPGISSLAAPRLRFATTVQDTLRKCHAHSH
jgi:hypothetical protein